ncbi:MAG: hypothetical protein EXR17_03385 [Flavobacteriaceae bacterium]|nr:hypothetical protein [Flavobacteriaceae bacterium]
MMGIPVWAWFFSLVISCLYVGFLYYPILRSNAKRLWFLAAIFRFLAVFFLVLVLFNPYWKSIIHRIEKPVLLVYSDASSSITDYDKLQSKSVLKRIKDIVGEKNLRIYLFGKDVSTADSLVSSSTMNTNISAVLKHAESIATQGPLSGIVIMSDGIVNSGTDPEFAIRPPQIPIISVGLGDPTPQKDVQVSSFLCNTEAYIGNTFVAEALVKSRLVNGKTLQLRLFQNAVLISSKQWVSTGDQDWKRIEFDIKPSKPGLMKLSLEIAVVEGEKNIANNTLHRFVKISDQRKRVQIVYGSPHPDVAAIRRALEPNGQFICEVNPNSASALDADVYILHGWSFVESSDLQKLKHWINEGKAIWIFATQKTQWTALSSIANLGVSNRRISYQEVQPCWNTHYMGWELTDQEKKIWQTFPPVLSPLVKISLPVAAEFPLKQKWSGIETQFPLMLHWNNNDATLALFLGEGIWRWRIQDKKNNGKSIVFDPWIRRMLTLLAAGNAARKNLEIQLPKDQFDLREIVTARVICRDRAGIVDDKIHRNLRMRSNDGRVREIPLQQSLGGWKASIGQIAAGEYNLIASASVLGNSKSEAQFSVVDQPLETMDLQANHHSLQSISEKSNGGFVLAKNPAMIDTLLKEKLRTQSLMRMDIQTRHWYDSIVWFLGIPLLFAGEWFIRRYLGKW